MLLVNNRPIMWQQLARRHAQGNPLKLKLNTRMGKKDRLVFQNLLVCWDFPFLGFTENDPEKRKCPVSGSSLGEHAYLSSKGQRRTARELLKLVGWQQYHK